MILLPPARSSLRSLVRLRTLLLAIAVWTSCACREDAGTLRGRALGNLRILVEDQESKVRKGWGFRAMEGCPAGRPWQVPRKGCQSAPGLKAAGDGLLHEQYGVRVDPVGIVLRSSSSAELGPSGRIINERVAGVETGPAWCDVFVIGLFSPGSAAPVRLVTRLERRPYDLVQSPVREIPGEWSTGPDQAPTPAEPTR